MPTYVLPQVLVFQDFANTPQALANPLRAHISGPHAQLIRFNQPTEQANGQLGYYDNLVDTNYAWPQLPAGGLVDLSYTKLWMTNALLQYFQTQIGQGGDVTKLAGYNNRVTSATRNFAANGATYPRYSGLLDRDVQPGDVAFVRGLDGQGNSVDLWTYVQSVQGVPEPAVIAAATADANNAATQAASATVTQVAGDINTVTGTPNGTAYSGLASGYVTETYDLLVTSGSVNGDFTKATLRVISGSGTDDQAAVTPAAVGSAFAVGTRGLTFTFSLSETKAYSASANKEGVTPEDLIVGQRWSITVKQAFTAPAATSGGTYASQNNTTYIVTVSRGGLYTTDTTKCPQITVTTTNGVDVSGPTAVTAANTAVACGTQGITVEFDQTGLRAGDRYYVEVTGEAVGPMRTLVLGHNLSSSIASGSEVDLTLYIRKPTLQIGQDRTGYAPLTNWDASQNEFTVHAGILAYDPTWTNNGVQEALPVYSESSQSYGLLFLETRYWLQDLVGEVNAISDVGTIDTAISGPLDPDNPLKWGVMQALTNSNGVDVKFSGVADPNDSNKWADVLGLLLGRDDVYGLVPLTHDHTVQQLYAAHVADQSTPEQGLWRVTWFNMQGVPEIPIVSAGSTVPGHMSATTTDGLVTLATVTQDPNATGTAYTILQDSTKNAAFLTNGVKAGDIVRLLYTSDGFGNTTYSEYVVDSVQSEDQLTLVTGPSAPVNVAAKFEVWRNLSATDEANAIAVNAGAWGSTRVRAVWPDQIGSGGTMMDGYFLCCALAGLSSGILPHQGMTHLQIVGFDDVSRTTSKFNRDQLDAMALGGVWIVTQDLTGIDTSVGQVYTRHAVTTGGYSNVNTREEMLIRNVDSISFRFKDQFKPFIGISNVTPSMQARLLSQVNTLIDTLKNEGNTTELGGQLIDATVVSLQPSALFLDRYVLQLQLQVPYPFNNLEIHLMI